MKRRLAIAAMFTLAGAAYSAGQDAKAEAPAPLKAKVALCDHSHVVGTPRITGLTMTTGFGKCDIPLHHVSTLLFVNGQAKTVLTNKNILTGMLEGTALTLDTSFGTLNIDYSKIASVTFATPQDAARLAHEDGLLLHVPLDAPDANLGAFDARIDIQDAQLTDGPFNDKALLFATPDAKATIHLPLSPYTMPEGTIAFWAKLPQPDQPFGDGRRQLPLFIVEQDEHEFFPLVFGFNTNNGAGNAGLVGIIWHFACTGTGTGATVEGTGLLGDTPGGWHHYAFIWKWKGLEFPEAQGYVLALAVDGKMVTSAGEISGFDDYVHLRNEPAKGRVIFHDGGKFDNLPPVAMSNFKIWNCAKQPTPIEN
ncbi:MAG: LamG domain-containing protein [Kiritimatiellaeota bacterium]|nr:LamG domain-containing protein [Kiritimatiellota bacterium]